MFFGVLWLFFLSERFCIFFLFQPCTVELNICCTLQYYYSIKDISIGGRCVCNGHADTCDRPPEVHGYKLICSCVHNTCGNQCEYCCPGFVQKRWRRARVNDPFVCERKLLNCSDGFNDFLGVTKWGAVHCTFLSLAHSLAHSLSLSLSLSLSV